MVVVAVEGSLLRHSVNHIFISGIPSTTPPSLLSTKQQQQEQHRRFSSSFASASASSSSAVSIYFPYVTYSSGASSTSSSLVATAIPRRPSIGGGSRITKATTLASLGHSGTVPITNPSRPAIASRPAGFVSGPTSRPVYAAIAETAGEGLKWWERGSAPNMIDVHSTQQFVDALSAAGDKLVVVEFFASWCPSCRALYPKFCKMAAENSDMFFLKVNFDENKPMCKSLNVKVLPFFHLYRGAEGRLDSFSCSLAKLQRLRDAISKHHDGPCEDCAPPELIGDVLDSLLDRVSPVRPSPDQPAAAARPSE